MPKTHTQPDAVVYVCNPELPRGGVRLFRTCISTLAGEVVSKEACLNPVPPPPFNTSNIGINEKRIFIVDGGDQPKNFVAMEHMYAIKAHFKPIIRSSPQGAGIHLQSTDRQATALT